MQSESMKPTERKLCCSNNKCPLGGTLLSATSWPDTGLYLTFDRFFKCFHERLFQLIMLLHQKGGEYIWPKVCIKILSSPPLILRASLSPSHAKFFHLRFPGPYKANVWLCAQTLTPNIALIWQRVV